ncbi:hypothetical protein KI387_015368, partial [Taxus chinensis]
MRMRMRVLRSESVVLGDDHICSKVLQGADPFLYNKMVYVFEAPTPTTEMLKRGLEKVLKYREFIKDLKNIEGVGLVEAEAEGRVADAMPFQPSPLLLELLPPTPTLVSDLFLLQLTRFTCGGLVIGMACHYHVADKEAIIAFLNCWGKM